MLFNKAAIKSSVFYLICTCILAIFIQEQGIIKEVGAWILAINTTLFAVMGKDKLSAIINWGRTPEGCLLWLAFLGAFPALFFARLVFNHKSSKTEFIRPMYFLLALQIFLLVYYFSMYDASFIFKTPAQ